MELLIPGLVLGSVYGLIALGYSLIYKASGLMSFVQGDIMTLGAYLGLTFFGTLRLPFLVALALTIVVAFILGLILEKGVIRKLLDKNVMAIYVVLATIAISYIIQNGVQIAWGTIALPFPSVFNVLSVTVLGSAIQPEVILCVIISLVLMVILHFFMTKTRLGSSMRAAAMNAKAAEAVGIDVSLSTGITWGLSAGLAAVAGMLIGPMYGVFSLLGATIGRKGFSAAVIGGYGNMYGAIVGGLILGLAEKMIAGFVSSTYQNVIAYVLLIVFLFLKPTGIFNEQAIQDV
ncbi:MAG: branched-chain amino acid ABC transporter permease [Saccharofermentanales bacterium]